MNGSFVKENQNKLVRWLFLVALSLLVLSLFAGCAPPEPPAQPEPEEERVAGIVEAEAVSQADEYGYVRAILSVQNGNISDVSFVEFDGVGVEKIYEDYHQRWPYLEDAHNEMAQRMIDENTWDVDIVSGATGTSEKAREAARFALQKATGEVPETEHFDGTFMGLSDATEKGWGIAWVTLENDQIVDIRLEGTTPALEDGEEVFDAVERQVFVIKDENYPWAEYHEAREVIGERIIETQSTDVDTYTGATGSSAQWMEATGRAMEAARVDGSQ